MNRSVAQLNNFHISKDLDSIDKLHIEVKGLGVVTLHHTDEGLIVDVFNNAMAENLISIALVNSDFFEQFADELQSKIEKFDPAINIDAEECNKAYRENTSALQFIETYFQSNQFNLSGLTPLKGQVKNYCEQIAELTRPYVKITDEQYVELKGQPAEFYINKAGMVFTFGTADGGYALMPINEAAAKKIINEQSLYSKLLSAGGLSQDAIKIFERDGWHLWQASGSYSDIELDVTFQTKEENGDDRYSFNLHFTFVWETAQTYMTLGVNLGGGFDEMHNVEHSEKPLNEQVEEFVKNLRVSTQSNSKKDELLLLIDSHPTAWDEVIAGAKCLSESLQITAAI